MEMIIVDDGSKDDTLGICQSYDDSRIRVLHKENGGVSSARNMGLKFAQGDYIAFIDSDDFIETDYLQHLSHGFGSDIVITGFSMVLFPKLLALNSNCQTSKRLVKNYQN